MKTAPRVTLSRFGRKLHPLTEIYPPLYSNFKLKSRNCGNILKSDDSLSALISNVRISLNSDVHFWCLDKKYPSPGRVKKTGSRTSFVLISVQREFSCIAMKSASWWDVKSDLIPLRVWCIQSSVCGDLDFVARGSQGSHRRYGFARM